ncbi:MAG TPA: hypothetical protein VHA13_00560 [Gammaproteobacteria bacterium]|nr:hypothetical protein [Gammaproteobacteria bacterium]
MREVSKDDTLYIYCHGYVDKFHKPTGEIGGDTFYFASGKKTKKEVKLTPLMLAEHLEREGLNFEHKKLKLFSCYSSEFVPLLSVIMGKKWKDLEIYGYKNETIPAGTDFHKIAGLTYEEGVAYRKADKEIMEKEKAGLFRAKLHRVAYKNGKQIEFEVSNEEKKIESAVNELDENFSNLKLK